MKATFQAIALTSTNQRKATLKAKKAHESLLDRSLVCWSVLKTLHSQYKVKMFPFALLFLTNLHLFTMLHPDYVNTCEDVRQIFRFCFICGRLQAFESKQ